MQRVRLEHRTLAGWSGALLTGCEESGLAAGSVDHDPIRLQHNHLPHQQWRLHHRGGVHGLHIVLLFLSSCRDQEWLDLTAVPLSRWRSTTARKPLRLQRQAACLSSSQAGPLRTPHRAMRLGLCRYNVIKNWDYVALCKCFDNGEGAAFATRVSRAASKGNMFSAIIDLILPSGSIT